MAQESSPEQLVASSMAEAREQLVREFDANLTDPATYRIKALEECGIFPEGRIYPFFLPALSYANLAFSGDMPPEEAAGRMRLLIDLGIPEVAAYVKAPDGDLMQMSTYKKQATFLTMLNFTLGNYALVSDDGRYTALQNHISRLLLDALDKERGGPIASYPSYTWYFDTIMAFASLNLWQQPEGRAHARSLYEKHLEWRNSNIMLESGLPRATFNGLSRGCDLSMQICLLASFDPKETQRLYEAYVDAHWKDLGFAAGFTEWPREQEHAMYGDVDSGPVVFGIGATATGIGIGTTKAAGDKERLFRLVAELSLARYFIHASDGLGRDSPYHQWLSAFAPFDPNSFSGFLYGDCALFYALTWVPR